MPNYLSPGVYVEEVQAGSRPIEGVGTAVAAFVGFAANGPFNQPTLVSNWSQFTGTFGDFIDGAYLAHAVYGFFFNGGGAAYVVRVGQDGADDSGSKQSKPALSGPRQAELGGYRVAELEAGDGKTDISIEIEPPSVAEGETAAPEDMFKLVVKRGRKTEETFDRVRTNRGKDNVVTAVKQGSKLITIEETGGTPAPAKPQVGSVVLAPPPAAPAAPARISTDDYIGDSAPCPLPRPPRRPRRPLRCSDRPMARNPRKSPCRARSSSAPKARSSKKNQVSRDPFSRQDSTPPPLKQPK